MLFVYFVRMAISHQFTWVGGLSQVFSPSVHPFHPMVTVKLLSDNFYVCHKFVKSPMNNMETQTINWKANVLLPSP